MLKIVFPVLIKNYLIFGPLVLTKAGLLHLTALLPLPECSSVAATSSRTHCSCRNISSESYHTIRNSEKCLLYFKRTKVNVFKLVKMNYFKFIVQNLEF